MYIKNGKRYRPNVACIVVSSAYPFESKILIASRNDMSDTWQFPQGGIDKDETPEKALFRELKEEIGTNNIEIIAEYPELISYDFPENIAKKMAPFDGQIQKYYLVRLKDDKEINLNTEIPEFSHYKFVKYHDIFNYVTFFKRSVYQNVLVYFKKLGYL